MDEKSWQRHLLSAYNGVTWKVWDLGCLNHIGIELAERGTVCNSGSKTCCWKDLVGHVVRMFPLRDSVVHSI